MGRRTHGKVLLPYIIFAPKSDPVTVVGPSTLGNGMPGADLSLSVPPDNRLLIDTDYFFFDRSPSL